MDMRKRALTLMVIALPLLMLWGCNDGKRTDGILRDSRDGKVYRTVKIGKQEWMAVNLNYKAGKSFCNENKDENCLKDGRLYTWAAAINKPEYECGIGKTCSLPPGKIQGVCPNGWHLPSLEEWHTLFKAVGGMSKAAKALKTTHDWYEGCDGTDTYGFSVKPNGFFGNHHESMFFNDDSLFFVESSGDHTYFWTSTGDSKLNAYAIDIPYSEEAAPIDVFKNYGFSVRCVKDDDGDDVQENKEAPKTVATAKREFDSHKYKTVQIGNHIWMAENLNEPTEESYCYEDNPQNCEKYGRLYTFKAAQKACPLGWHLANSKDEMDMLRALGESDREKQGVMLASKEWMFVRDYGDTRLPGMDVLGLAILPAGEKMRGMYARKGRSPFYGLGSIAYIWLDSYYGGCCSHMMEINNNYYSSVGHDTSAAMAVRCVKDYEETPARKETLHLNGKFVEPHSSTKGSFKDPRDNYTYKTVTIGEQTWFAENLQYKTNDATCNNGDENCSQFGRLYDWYSAMEACPQGWRLPSSKEVYDLRTAVGGSASKIKSISGWVQNGGTDDYGLSILPIGGKSTYMWTSSKKENLESASYFALSFGHERIIISSCSTKQMHSVRCIKD